jgi:hypothetical protein
MLNNLSELDLRVQVFDGHHDLSEFSLLAIILVELPLDLIL